MENSIYLGLSRQMALQTNMDMIANNVANMSTPGYRGQNLMFEEYISAPRGTDDALSFVYNKGQYQNTTPGPVQFTENPLDIYMDGPGFFGVQGPGGEVVYSRAGNFTKSADGTLVTAAGFPVADTGGGSITIPESSTEIAIDEKGFVSDQSGKIGQIMVAEFANVQELEPIGNNMYRTDAQAQGMDNTRVKQGQLEGSNIQPITEMNRMIKTLRHFQMVQQMMQSENERMRGAIEKLTGQG